MSHQIVECPGCLTKLRVRESRKVITLQCPRCGEQLAVDPPESLSPVTRPSAPASNLPDRTSPSGSRDARPSKPPAPSSATSQNSSSTTAGNSGKRSENQSGSEKRAATSGSVRGSVGTQGKEKASGSDVRSSGSRRSGQSGRKSAAQEYDYDEDPWNSESSWEGSNEEQQEQSGAPSKPRRKTQPQKNGNGLKSGLIAGGVLALAAVIVFAVSHFMRSSSDAGSPIDLASSGYANGSGIAAGNPGGMPAYDSGTASPPPTTPVAPVAPSTAAPDAPTSTFAGVPVPPATVPPAGGIAPGGQTPPSAGAAGAAISGGNRLLRYHWKPGAEYVYSFTIESGSGDEVTKTSGQCSYTVQGSSSQSVPEEESSGTGFVVSADGVIATCAHVVEGATNIDVHLGGRQYPATVIAVDPGSDVALIRINAAGLSPLPLSDSDSVQLAESVLAIGFPLSDVLGVDVKVTTGTVAGIIQGRERGRQIQIDAAINPGNSGGPVVNGAGQVIGIASAKLSGASVTSVGFAAPINQLRTLSASRGMQLAVSPRGQILAGPEVARRVTPSVVYIKVRGSSGGRLSEVSYTANFHDQPQIRSLRGGFPRPPSFGSSSMDRGRLTVNHLGVVMSFEGNEQLPAVLGPVGVFFLEPLDAYSETQWHVESESRLQRIKRDDSPIGRLGPRMRGFGPPGFGPPGFGGGNQDQVMEEIPAIERVTYQAGQTLNNRLAISKKYEFTATRSGNQPYMNIRGNGTLVFDLNHGMPFSLEYTATIEHTDEGATSRVPIRVNYTLRDPEEVKREREQFARKAEEDRQRQEQNRTVANPELVDELIAEIRKASGGSGASQPLSRLGDIAIVEQKRDEVIRIAQNHMKNSNGFVRKSATEAFAHWAAREHVDELKKILDDKDGLLHPAKRIAIRTYAGYAGPDDYPTLIQSVNDSVIRTDARNALISIGPAVETAILEGFDSVGQSFSKTELLEVLKQVGTEKSIPFLESLATGRDFTVRSGAQQALDAIRSRL